LKKLFVVFLFVFLASIFVAGTAFAVTRQIPDLGNPVDAAVRGTAVDAGAGILSADEYVPIRSEGIHMLRVSGDFSPLVSIISKDNWHQERFPDAIQSSDYEFLKSDVASYAVPDGVIALLKGGDSYRRADRADQADHIGFTIQSNAALHIVRHHSANPGSVHPQLYATNETDISGTVPDMITAGDTTLLVPYMLSADVLPSAGRTVAIPVPLNFVGSNVVQQAYLDGAWRSGVPQSFDAELVGNISNAGDRLERRPTARFRGMRASDIRLIKVHKDNLAAGSSSYVRRNTAGTLGLNEFVVTRLVNGRDIVLQDNDLIAAGGAGTDDYYRVIYKIADGTHDLSATGDGIVVDPVIIFADNPITKFPSVNGVPITTHQTMGYMPRTREGVGVDYDLQPRAWPGPNATANVANNLYPDYTRQQFEVVNGLLWHSNASIAAWGGLNLQPNQVVKFPGTLARTFAGNTALVVYTIRPGAGFHGGSIGLDQLVGRPISDLRVFSLTGNADEDREYEQVFNAAHLSTAHRDGTFAVLRLAANDPNFQEVITDPNHVFAAGGVYFLAVAARDGGEFDVDQGLQGNGQGKNNECVHFSVFAAVDAATPSVTPTVTPSVVPSVVPSETPSEAPSGGSSGGCSVGGFAPATLLLLAPLFLLLKK